MSLSCSRAAVHAGRPTDYVMSGRRPQLLRSIQHLRSCPFHSWTPPPCPLPIAHVRSIPLHREGGPHRMGYLCRMRGCARGRRPEFILAGTSAQRRLHGNWRVWRRADGVRWVMGTCATAWCGYVCSTQPQRWSAPRRLWVILTQYCRIKAAVLWFVACSYALVAVDRQNPRIRSARRREGSLMTNEPWVSVDDLAKHLGVAKDSVYRWIDHKGLPAHKIGRLWKFKLSEVDDWVRDGGASGDEPGQDGKGRRG